MLDYASLRAVAAVVQTGSFEKAARALNVTPSAVSQRVKQLEERLGLVLIARGSPCVATEKGAWLCRHMEHVGLLEADLLTHLPGLAPPADGAPAVTVPVATSADSLGTWFLDAVAEVAASTGHLFSIAVDDEEHTAEWLRRGQVVAAVTSLEAPVPGCRRLFLGRLRYHAVASPAFLARHCPDGVTAKALSRAPALTFNQKDRLQERWLRQVFGETPACPTHWLPSTQGFLEASLRGMGWGMNPAPLVAEHLRQGRLVELVPGQPLDVALYWQINRLSADRLSGLTAAVTAAARHRLLA
ncbi:LysR family transcriptional regulator ArgP [Ensifer soli]|uniref:LysR family transcriptional regulator ArgP n=1 Tax=Ciceribacter sp. sgz301302 TaxID=3342379 RepID=UPI0035B7B385